MFQFPPVHVPPLSMRLPLLVFLVICPKPFQEKNTTDQVEMESSQLIH